MIVVSDTSPLNYLVLMNHEELLPSLFGRVLAPPGVVEELKHPDGPGLVRAWAASPPSWLEVRLPQTIDSSIKLGLGEVQAISLAQELSADIVLIDERKATREAQRRGLTVTGTLGVRLTASRRGLVDLPTALDALPISFRVTPELLRMLREGNRDPK